ncbi:MAG: 4Fe-4S dicluster domain-containing protein, partial [Methylacidiphilales bacterium]|nr:4Fe-4S dicluster domain-containing protein [Candidatus Methylacidiphilales bacterium]
MNRRCFIKLAVKGSAAVLLVRGLDGIFRPADVLAGASPRRFVFLVDTYKCIGCGFCVKACKLENEIPFDADVSRTWVERYVVTGEGDVLADTPQEARHGFTTGRFDLGRGKFKDIPSEIIRKGFFVPKLCNQCAKPPCVQVCPV